MIVCRFTSPYTYSPLLRVYEEVVYEGRFSIMANRNCRLLVSEVVTIDEMKVTVGPCCIDHALDRAWYVQCAQYWLTDLTLRCVLDRRVVTHLLACWSVGSMSGFALLVYKVDPFYLLVLSRSSGICICHIGFSALRRSSFWLTAASWIYSRKVLRNIGFGGLPLRNSWSVQQCTFSQPWRTEFCSLIVTLRVCNFGIWSSHRFQLKSKSSLINYAFSGL